MLTFHMLMELLYTKEEEHILRMNSALHIYVMNRLSAVHVFCTLTMQY